METMTSATVQAEMLDVAGSPVAVRRRGTGDPLLFLHGAGFTGRWLRFHEALAAGADVIAPEHIGFGATPPQDWWRASTTWCCTTTTCAAPSAWRRSTWSGTRWVVTEIDAGARPGWVLRVGWIAAAYAVTYPERLRSLTLITPIGLRIPGRPPFADLFQMEPEQLMGTVFNDPSNMAEIAVDPTDLDTVVHVYEEYSTLARLVWNPRYDRRLPRRLRRVDWPSLVVGAENDRLVPNEACDLYAEYLPDARVQRTPGTGHAIVVEQPEATARAILDFTGSVS